MTETPPESKTTSRLAIAGFGISLLSLALSGITAYWTNFRFADVEVRASDMVGISYQWQRNLHMLVSLNFSNTGARQGSIRGLRLECSNGISLYAAYYYKLAPQGNIEMSNMVVPEIVKANETSTRNVLFSSTAGWLDSHKLQTGTFPCRIAGEVGESDSVLDKFEIVLKQEHLAWLERNAGRGNLYLFTRQSRVPDEVLPPQPDR